MNRHHYQRGLTLLEILVALTVGLVVITGTIQIYLGSSQTYRVQEALSRVQENGRYATELLNREIRMAGFTGCPRNNAVVNVLNDPTANWWSDFPTLSLRGYAGNEAFPARSFGTDSGDRVNGTDALILIGGGGQGYTISDNPPHNPQSAQFKLNEVHDLRDGDIVMVCNLEQTAIMQLTNVNTNNVTIVHNTGNSVSPGNCTKFLGSPDPAAAPDPTAISLCDDAVPYSYGSDATLVDFTPLAFYIGVSAAGDSRSLYRIRIRADASGDIGTEARELVEHVEEMRILYGVDTTGNRRIDEYVEAAEVTANGDWPNVLSVRVNLLLASTPDARVITEPQSVTFPAEAPGDGALVSGAAVTFDDGRLRHAFSTTIGIRNRLP